MSGKFNTGWKIWCKTEDWTVLGSLRRECLDKTRQGKTKYNIKQDRARKDKSRCKVRWSGVVCKGRYHIPAREVRGYFSTTI